LTTPSFRDLGVPKKLNESLHRQGLRTPFPIQVQSLPHALAGRDLCGRAPTGSGKTLAFSIPVVERSESARPHHPRALVLVPTRELAGQVREAILPLAQARGRWVATFYGGTSIRRDVDRLRRGVDIAVATPGRLADLVQRGDIHLDEVQVVVVDEADRMADMGFLPEVRRLLDRTPDTRQTLLFSATLDGDVDVLVRAYQRDPVRVEVAVPTEEAGRVNHLFWATQRHERRAVAAEILRHSSGPAIVFTRTKHGADRLAKQLASDGVTTAAIHGNRSQRQREAALARFARGEVRALIATDVAARGIHVDGVELVVHFDLPGSEKDYVHRSGRTGRAGRDGVVVSLVCEDQHRDLHAMQEALSMTAGTHDVAFAHLRADMVPDPTARRSPADAAAPRTRARPPGARTATTGPARRSTNPRQRHRAGGARRRTG